MRIMCQTPNVLVCYRFVHRPLFLFLRTTYSWLAYQPRRWTHSISSLQSMAELDEISRVQGKKCRGGALRSAANVLVRAVATLCRLAHFSGCARSQSTVTTSINQFCASICASLAIRPHLLASVQALTENSSPMSLQNAD